jgi:hypothetical protein
MIANGEGRGKESLEELTRQRLQRTIELIV